MPRVLSNGFKVIHGHRMEDLRALVVNLIREHPLPPLEDEIILVQSNGIAQWLKLALAADREPAPDQPDQEPGCGIAAGLRLLMPYRFVWEMYRLVLGPNAVPLHSPLDKDRLLWRLYEDLPAFAEQPVAAPLRRFLAGEPASARRFQLAERIADLFDNYQVYRADWLADWAQGRDQLRLVRGETRPVPMEDLWQPALWREVLHRTQVNAGRGAVHQQFLQAVQAAGLLCPADLPARIIVFGVSALPRQTLEVLSLLSRWVQVVLCVHNPCEYYWADLIEDRDLFRAAQRRGKVHPRLTIGGDDLSEAGHPLLASWGRQGRDYMRLLDEFDQPDQYRREFDRIDLFLDTPTDSVLAQLQDDIRHLRPLAETRECWPAWDPKADRSLVFQVAHSPQREVEILHDWLLHCFQEDPQLRPRDILVMVPDIATYAPHIEAVFGQWPMEEPRHIPFTISDQGTRHRVPVLLALEQLLNLPESRVGAGEVLDLLDIAPVRQRFGLTEGDLPLLRRWIEASQIRWGLDEHHREDLGLGAAGRINSWAFGLDRLMLGYGVGRGKAWEDIEPCDEVGGLEAAVLGPLWQCVQSLQAWRSRLQIEQPPAAWSTTLRELCADFLSATDPEDWLTLNRLETALQDWLSACGEAAVQVAMPVAIVREVILGAMDQTSLSQRFMAGRVNFATLMPMRAIPFRRIALLGLQDGAYPRPVTRVDFDLTAQDRRPGDRSRREEDRYLFLEALLSARDQLYISWVGRGIQDNAECPPSVLVAQLLDHLKSGWRPSGALVTEHPLQPFSPRYGQRASDGQGLFTYAREWLAARQTTGTANPVAVPLPAAPLPEEPVLLADLQGVLKRPVAFFCRRRLGVRFDPPPGQGLDEEPFALDGLERWQLHDELLQRAVMTSLDEPTLKMAVSEAAASMARRGDLGVGPVQAYHRQAIEGTGATLYQHWQAALTRVRGERCTLSVAFDWPVAGGTLRLRDHVTVWRESDAPVGWCLWPQPGTLLEKDGKTVRQHRLLEAWVQHVALQAVGLPVQTLVVGSDACIALPPESGESARSLQAARLQDWLALLWDALQRPLPLAFRTGLAWLQEPARAREVYDGGARQTGEREQDRALRRFFPDFVALTEGSDFDELTQRLYGPLLAQSVEVLDD